ncbi:hypothetical protein BH20CHL2_BH20CHL2_13580 [soil metagenome]
MASCSPGITSAKHVMHNLRRELEIDCPDACKTNEHGDDTDAWYGCKYRDVDYDMGIGTGEDLPSGIFRAVGRGAENGRF